MHVCVCMMIVLEIHIPIIMKLNSNWREHGHRSTSGNIRTHNDYKFFLSGIRNHTSRYKRRWWTELKNKTGDLKTLYEREFYITLHYVCWLTLLLIKLTPTPNANARYYIVKQVLNVLNSLDNIIFVHASLCVTYPYGNHTILYYIL